MRRTLINFLLAIEGVSGNKLRAFLTGLGIMFGVGAVITMLAIGTGARESILEQLKLIGTNNIVIKSLIPGNEEEGQGGQGLDETKKKDWTPGLTLADAQAMERIIPTTVAVSPEVVFPSPILYNGKMVKSRCVGIENSFFKLNNLEVDDEKYFHPHQMEEGSPVCIIGKNIQTRLFGGDNPLGKRIKVGNNWMTVVGVLKRRQASEENLATLGLRDLNNDVFVPVRTALLRIKNRAYINKASLSQGEEEEEKAENYHQLDRIVVEVDDTRYLSSTADLIARMLKRRHRDVVDFEIEVPELLVEQQQKTQDTFNFVLAVIAGISLLVGGIGIMNIMLASVMERIREIGVRRSLGATKQDIIWQFLFEAVFISLIGGITGVVIGVASSYIISSYAEIPTIVSLWSVLLSFGVAATVGLVFGIFPARRAANQDPIKALRTE